MHGERQGHRLACVRKSLCFINDDETIMEAVLNHAHATKLLAKFCACVAIQPG